MVSKRIAGALAAVAVVAALQAGGARAQTTSETLTFTPVADAYVDAAAPGQSFGTTGSLKVDAKSVKQSFMKFDLSGIGSRHVTNVRLRLYQKDTSPFGGRVARSSSNSWNESVTWNSRPPIDGATLGSFGAVGAGTWYEISLGAAVAGDGTITLAMDSANSDGSRWGSRDSSNPPQLIVEVTSKDKPTAPPTTSPTPTPPPPPPPGDRDVFTFRPTADVYVTAGSPATSFGTSTFLYADASPVMQSFLRFDVSGIAGRTVTDVKLRVFVNDPSPSGGTVHRVPSTSWAESTTYDTKPSYDAAGLGSFGAVSVNSWHQVSLGPIVSGNGPVALAVDSTSSDAARWSSRETVNPPQLIVETAAIPGYVADGLMEIASPYTGSSDPTYYPSNRRLAITQSGRLLTLHGRHSSGVQLAWRDAGGGWQTRTTGAVSDGLLVGNTGTGDWPASIATARDSAGAQHAWAVWSGAGENEVRPVQLRRLNTLDAATGPSVGPAVDVSPSGSVQDRADLAFETTPSGAQRGAVVWLKKTSDTSWDLLVSWFTNLDTDTPSFTAPTVLTSATNSNVTATLVPTAGGLKAVVRTGTGNLRVFSHAASDPLGTWTAGAAGMGASPRARPSAVALANGGVAVAAETDTTNNVVKVQRFSAAGAPAAAELTLTGYAQPSLAGDGTNLWLVMIRKSDGAAVSRQYAPSTGWSTTDRVEISGLTGLAYPNTLREVDGRLRFVVRGPAGTSSRSSALSFQRPL
ncbi:MAG TPA: DNRLRE domain-containing protein [Actinomycetota bacterium]|nr:DNRLRE domain-containing protein [Actinomycetota bacterium]